MAGLQLRGPRLLLLARPPAGPRLPLLRLLLLPLLALSAAGDLCPCQQPAHCLPIRHRPDFEVSAFPQSLHWLSRSWEKSVGPGAQTVFTQARVYSDFGNSGCERPWSSSRASYIFKAGIRLPRRPRSPPCSAPLAAFPVSQARLLALPRLEENLRSFTAPHPPP